MNNPRQFEVVGFDIDETFAPSISWRLLTVGLGASLEKHLGFYEDLKSGKLTLVQAQNKLVNLWQLTGNANVGFIKDLFEKREIYPASFKTVKYLQAKGYRLVVISGGVDLYVETIAKRLGITDFYANTKLIWEGDDLVGMEYELDQAGKKLEQLKDYLKNVGVSKNKCVFVGDSDNDKKVMVYTKHGILVKTPEYTKEMGRVAWKVIDKVGVLKQIL